MATRLGFRGPFLVVERAAAERSKSAPPAEREESEQREEREQRANRQDLYVRTLEPRADRLSFMQQPLP